MPRFRKVKPASSHDPHQPDRREKPWRHPLGWSREQVDLVRFNARIKGREQAIEAARSTGSVVHVPLDWSWDQGSAVGPSNAHVGTAFVRLPRLHVTPMPLSDALAGRRPLFERRVVDAEDIPTRWFGHEHGMRVAARGGLEPHPAGEVAGGMAIATIVATSGPARSRVSSTHVARVGALLEATFATSDAARAVATGLLLRGEESSLLAIVRTPAGVRLARVESSLPGFGDGDPLVDGVAGAATTLEWRASTRSLVALVGIDGVRRFSS